jgi:membrane protease YdiL (CAAX protease family)
MVAAMQHHPLAFYFTIVYGASAVALFVIGPPNLEDRPAHLALTPLVVFPLLVITVGAAGVGLSAATGARSAVVRLLLGAASWHVSPVYYLGILLPPAAIAAALLLLMFLIGPAYTPSFFPIGIAFGILAGFFEEFGWSGFAYPRMRTRFGALPGAAILGLLWGLWHLPVVDSLGAATPHGPAWPFFFGAFIVMLTALRILIAWVFASSGSLLLAQLTHASSTGFLVVLGAARVTAAQEATWYALYGLLLGLAALACWLAKAARLPETIPARAALSGQIPG